MEIKVSVEIDGQRFGVLHSVPEDPIERKTVIDKIASEVKFTLENELIPGVREQRIADHYKQQVRATVEFMGQPALNSQYDPMAEPGYTEVDYDFSEVGGSQQ